MDPAAQIKSHMIHIADYLSHTLVVSDTSACLETWTWTADVNVMCEEVRMDEYQQSGCEKKKSSLLDCVTQTRPVRQHRTSYHLYVIRSQQFGQKRTHPQPAGSRFCRCVRICSVLCLFCVHEMWTTNKWEKNLYVFIVYTHTHTYVYRCVCAFLHIFN